MKKITEYKEPNLGTIVGRVKKYLDDKWEYAIKLVEMPNKTYMNYIMNSKDEFEEIEREITAIWHLHSVRNEKKIEEVVQKLIPLFSEFELKFQLDKRFYESICEIRDSDKTLTKEQRLHLEKQIKSYKLEGIDLPDQTKKELSEINERMSILSTEFGANVIDCNKKFKYEVEVGDAEEMPKIEADKLRNEDGTYSVDTINDYMNFMKYSPNRHKREELYKLYVTRSPQNEKIIDETISLRDKKRQILNFDSYAELILEERDADSVEEVLEVLEYLIRHAKPKAESEIAQLKEYAKKLDGLEDFGIQDLSYYSELYRKEYFDVDQNKYKPYFEHKSIIKGFIDFIKEYSGIDFVQNKDDTLAKWHKDVLIYDLEENGNVIGRIYYDLHEREDKSSGAWKSSVMKHHIDHNGDTVLPVCNVVCNFEKKDSDGISLLTHSDVVTFFHEMGHAIHQLFSKVEINSLSGTSVNWDVVEFPSQFLEYYAYEKEVLEKFAKHYQTGKVIPEEMIEKLQKAKNYLNGYATMRQAEFALFDMNLHKGGVPNALETLQEVRGQTSVIDVPEYDRFHHTFGHIFAGGYAAGYYSYKWAEILSAGAYYAVKSSNDKVGKFKEYKELVLEKGGTINMVEQYNKLVGKSPDPTDLLRMDGIIED